MQTRKIYKPYFTRAIQFIEPLTMYMKWNEKLIKMKDMLNINSYLVNCAVKFSMTQIYSDYALV